MDNRKLYPLVKEKKKKKSLISESPCSIKGIEFNLKEALLHMLYGKKGFLFCPTVSIKYIQFNRFLKSTQIITDPNNPITINMQFKELNFIYKQRTGQTFMALKGLNLLDMVFRSPSMMTCGFMA